jgi:hypothetical protein
MGTVRAHLTAAASRGSARAAERLVGPHVPELLRYLLEWSIELAMGRRVGMNGPEQISWMDLDAWARMTGRSLDPHEAQGLMLIDAVRLNPGPLQWRATS